MFKNMSTTARVLLGLFAAFVMLAVMVVIWVIASYVSANNYAASTESAIEARWKDNQNVFSNYGQKVMEAAQVPTMYKDDLTQVMKTTIISRYGDGGSKAAFQWLKEANIPFDSKLYINLQQIIEAGRNDFQNAQTARLDVCRQYVGEQDKIPRGWFMRLAGYPKIDSKKCEVVSDDRTDKAFTTLKQDTIKLR